MNINDSLEQELETILPEYANNEDFVEGVLDTVTHEDDKKKLLEFIKAGKNVTSNSILEYSYHLMCVRDGEPEYKFMKTSFPNGWPD